MATEKTVSYREFTIRTVDDGVNVTGFITAPDGTNAGTTNEFFTRDHVLYEARDRIDVRLDGESGRYQR